MVDIFISYSRNDRDRVQPIAEALEHHGFEIWWDRRIGAGEEFDAAIEQAISQARAVLVVWSRHSRESRWVKEEAEDGLERSCLFPCMIDKVTIPRGFRRIQTVDLSDGRVAVESVEWLGFVERMRTELAAGRKPELTPAPEREPPPAPAQTRKWPRKRLAAALAPLLVLAAGLVFALWPGGTGSPALADVSALPPTVIGIYPSDSFGPQQKRGLHLALEASAPDVRIVDLEAPIDTMKRRSVPAIEKALRAALAKQNVVAIIGPSVTEYTRPIIDLVEKSGRRPAMLLTTAGPRKEIGWEGSNLPIFRIGSSIDERARDFSNLARGAIASGLDIVFLVEKLPNEAGDSYGEVFFRNIAANIEDWEDLFRQGRISRIYYERGRAVESIADEGRTEIFDDPNTLILLLGIGSDYRDLVTHFYGAGDSRRRASIGAWMSAYATDKPYREAKYQYDRLFDISDIFHAPADRTKEPYFQPFFRNFGMLDPSRRDEAISYDSGIVVEQALKAAGKTRTAEAIVAKLRSATFEGISGPIRFRADGRNSGPAGGLQSLKIVYFDKGEHAWQMLRDPNALFRRHRGTRPSTKRFSAAQSPPM